MPVVELSTLTTSSIALSTLATNQIFHKGILFNVRNGYGAGGFKTEVSRLKNRIGKHLAVRYVSHV
jgi:hypothetical protein